MLFYFAKRGFSIFIFNTNGYIHFRNDRLNNRGGGTGAYIRSDIKPKIVFLTNNDQLNIPEMLFVDITLFFKSCLA